ncbi:MAG: arsinothricin resistance N-acetyltransferase ArsN1 family B [Sphingobium sp.]
MPIVRRATADDAARCAQIYAPFVSDTVITFEEDAPGVDEMAGRIATFGASHAWLVAEEDGHIAGYAYASPHNERAAYRSSVNVGIYVDPAFARCGIGRALYAELFARLKAQGRHAAFALITLPNEPSIALHEAFGFEPVGVCREVGWKHGQWRDVGWWQLIL